MSVTFSSYACVGVKVDPDKLITKTKVKAYNHNYGHHMNFCPDTGKALWTYNETELEFDEFSVIYTTDDKEAVIGIAELASQYKDCVQLPIVDIEETKIKLKAKLEPFGLWNENKFGIWAILHCSY